MAAHQEVANRTYVDRGAAAPRTPRLSRSFLPLMQRLTLVLRGRHAAIRLLGLLMLLVVDRLGVHGPEVVIRTGGDVLDRAQGGDDRLMGVVVTVQAVAAALLEVGDPLEPVADGGDPLAVVGVVHRVG